MLAIPRITQESLNRSFSTDVHIDDMPTCGIFGLRVATDSWKAFTKAQKTFLFFDYPKAHHAE